MQRWIGTALLALLLSLPGGAAPAPTLPHDGSLQDPNIRYVGRWDRRNPGVFHSYWTGAYLRTAFTGTSVKIKLAAGTGLAVSVDGEPLREISASDGLTDLTTGPLKPGIHTLLVASQGQNYETLFQGLVLDAGAATRPVPAKPIIEYVGDSITVGVKDNYAWLTAEGLNCDHVQIAFSARALTSGYGCGSDHAGLDTQYFRLKNFNHSEEDVWDFSYTPQMVVINLGQNDQCGNEPADTMTLSYVRFVRSLRAKFPHAQIVALRPFGGPLEAAIRQAVATLNAGGDVRVHYLDTTGWLVPSDFRDGVHPNDIGNAKVAARLTPFLKPLLAE